MKHRWMLLAALASVTPGCKKEQPPEPDAEPSASSEAPAQAAGEPAPAPAAPQGPLAVVPQSDSTLSLLEPQGDQCEWARVDPVADKRAPVASFEGHCIGARIAWNADQSKALVWFDPNAVKSAGYASELASPPGYPDEQPSRQDPPRLYEVTIATGERRELLLPAAPGRAIEIGYGAKGPVGLYLQSLSKAQIAERSFTVDGQRLQLDFDSEGVPAIAYAFQLGANGKWAQVEVKATTEGTPYAPGVHALESSQLVGFRTHELLEPRFSGGSVSSERAMDFVSYLPAPLAARVRREGPPKRLKGWTRGSTSAGNFYLWQVTTDFTWSTGRLVFEDEGGQLQRVPRLGFTDGDLAAVRTQGPFLLVSSQHVGTHPHLYDLRTRERVFHSDEARAATFWPTLEKDVRAGAGSQ